MSHEFSARNSDFVSAIRKLLLAQFPDPKWEEWLGFVFPVRRQRCSLILYSHRLGDMTESGRTPVWCGVDDPERGCHGSPQSLHWNGGLK